MNDGPMRPAAIAEVLQRFIDAQRRGERVSDETLLLAADGVAELLRPPSMEELATCAAWGSYVGQEALAKLGAMDAEGN